ncbi:MAG: histidinol dehydrogenase, partial [Clostridia bacterium]|nr:histidinol dehydrogenase [Clostridia bacterium]
MIKIYDGEIKAEDIFAREEEKSTVGETVAAIIAAVRKNGDKALREYSEKFDKAKLESLEVTADEIDAAFNALEPEFISVIEEAAENIREFHRHQIKTGFVITPRDGVVLGQRVIPLQRVGLYVPGGTASYPSSVLMNCIPAKLAGCDEIVMVTPPSQDGSIKSAILVAAKIAGVDRIFKVGGAQAVAALAYSTETIPQVDKIVGPGNVFVAEAKRQVFGTVAIDMIAGPSEILVIADETCNPKFVAADMLSQAEHDKNASAVLITDSMALAKAV